MKNEMFDYILVVDDNAQRRSVFYDVLAQLNYNVDTIPAIDMVLEILKKERPKFMILNIPVFDKAHQDALRKVRDLSEGICIIALAGRDDFDAVAKELAGSGQNLILRSDADTYELMQQVLKLVKSNKTGIPAGANEGKKRGTVLIIDDEKALAQFFTVYFTNKGYNVIWAMSGEQALLMIQAESPKIILLDILMPGMDGLLVLKRIREINSSVCVVVISGLLDSVLSAEMLSMGATACLQKPFTLSELDKIIGANLNDARQKPEGK